MLSFDGIPNARIYHLEFRMAVEGLSFVGQTDECIYYIRNVPHSDAQIGEACPLVFQWVEVLVHELGVSPSYVVCFGSRQRSVGERFTVFVNVMVRNRVIKLIAEESQFLSQQTFWYVYTGTHEVTMQPQSNGDSP